MKVSFILALAALALSFALSGCSTSTIKTAPPVSNKSATGSEPQELDAGDPEAHRKTVVSRAEEFRRCYQPALKINPRLMGEVTLTWDVNSAGDVVREDVVHAHTTIADKAMLECMLDRVHNWKFDTGPKDQISTVTYPFYFSPPTR